MKLFARQPEFCGRCGYMNVMEVTDWGARWWSGRRCASCGTRQYDMADRPIDGRHIDFLGRPLSVGDYVVYPTGGQSARMVVAIITRLAHADHVFGDGHRRRTTAVVFVYRQREGEHTDTGERYGRVDSSKEVRVEQLHRVTIIPKALGKRATK